MHFNDHLQGILATLPDKPGCYLMKDSGGRIIYVGKAVNLRARVRSYFHTTAHEHPKTHKLVSEIIRPGTDDRGRKAGFLIQASDPAIYSRAWVQMA